MTDKDQELVLCVQSSAVRDLFAGRTWLPHDGNGLTRLMRQLGDAFFIARGKCESDPSFKQVIPYIILASEGKFYRYTRGTSGGEDRLHGNFSVGLGGHINMVDRHDNEYPARAIRGAAERELTEEVGINFRGHVQSSRLAGLISHDDDPVGAVHLGVCFVVELYEPEIKGCESAIADGQWVTADELQAEVGRLERWSQIALDMVLAPATPGEGGGTR